MIQPYLADVDEAGELGLVSFDGRHSHSFRKGPLLQRGAMPTPDLFAAEDITAADAPAAARNLAAAALEVATRTTGASPLYARVDLVTKKDGPPTVLELELIEPSMYHGTDPGSARRFAAAILSRTG